MKEKSKTILLNSLVLLSFLLSWLLWTSQPDLEPIDPPQYLDPKPLGEKEDLEKLLRPESIIFHYGEDKHTKALPEMAHYNIILKEMGDWYFYDFQPERLTTEDWKNIIEKNKGLEIIYHDSVPISILSRYFMMEGLFQETFDKVDRIYLYLEPEDEILYAFFISNETKEVVRARTAVTPYDLKNSYLSIGSKLPEQIVRYNDTGLFLQSFYLPKNRSKVKEFRYFYQPITINQIMQSLFINPSLTRKIIERDGTIIYTDGSHGIQITSDKKRMIYHEPVLEAEGDTTLRQQLISGVGFVNQHGGWTGDFVLENIEDSESKAQVELQFREYVGSYPLYGAKGSMLGSLILHLDHENVSSYQRSLVQLDRFMYYQNEQVISGPELIRYLGANNYHLYLINDIHLVYKGEVAQDYIHLYPVWVLEKTNGQTEFLPAEVTDIDLPPPPKEDPKKDLSEDEEADGKGDQSGSGSDSLIKGKVSEPPVKGDE